MSCELLLANEESSELLLVKEESDELLGKICREGVLQCSASSIVEVNLRLGLGRPACWKVTDRFCEGGVEGLGRGKIEVVDFHWDCRCSLSLLAHSAFIACGL